MANGAPLAVNVTRPDDGTALTIAVTVLGIPAAIAGGLARYMFTPEVVTDTTSGTLVQLAPHVVFALGVPAPAGW